MAASMDVYFCWLLVHEIAGQQYCLGFQQRSVYSLLRVFILGTFIFVLVTDYHHLWMKLCHEYIMHVSLHSRRFYVSVKYIGEVYL